MKIASLLAGVAAVALTAGAASAQDINWGQFVHPMSGVTVGAAPLDLNRLRAQGNPDPSDWRAGASSWHAYGEAVDNNGTAAGSDGATFTLKGLVSTDCAYYSGNNNTETLDFGQIGIYASDDTGPAAAFTMVDEATVTIDTNLAGCNT